jgi:hypothetical protein
MTFLVTLAVIAIAVIVLGWLLLVGAGFIHERYPDESPELPRKSWGNDHDDDGA